MLRASLPTVLGWACIGVLASFGCGNQNPIEEGEPIPDAHIVSCGDELLDLAKPSGALSNTLLSVSETETVLEGEVIWQASCPDEESDAETEFVLRRVTLYRNDAGYPGDELGSTDVELRAVVSCGQRATSQIGGASIKEAFASTKVSELSGLCAEYAAMPTGMPLYAQVEMDGSSITCSNEENSLHFLSKTFIECPP